MKHFFSFGLLSFFCFVCIGSPLLASAQQPPALTRMVCCRCHTNKIDDFCVKTTDQELRNKGEDPFKFVSCDSVVNSQTYKDVAQAHTDEFQGFACEPGQLFGGACAQKLDTIADPQAKCVTVPTKIKDLPTLLNPAKTPDPLNANDFIKPVLGVDIPGLVFGEVIVDESGRAFAVPFIAQYISAVYRYLVGIIAIIAIIMIMYGGFRYLVGSVAGDVKAGKEIIVNALVGLGLALSTVLILRTVNPLLLKPAPIQVENIAVNFGEQPGKDVEIAGRLGNTSKGDYDTLFQAYASCYGFDWRILKGIAAIESDLDTNNLTGSYKGLFQFDESGCRDNTRGYPATLVDCRDLFDPETNTAAGAARFAKATQEIIKKCGKNIRLEDAIPLLYVGHNNGPAVLEYALNQGACTQDKQKIAVRNYGPSHPNTRYARLITPDKGEAKWRYGISKGLTTIQSLGVKDFKIDDTKVGEDLKKNLCPLYNGRGRVLPFNSS